MTPSTSKSLATRAVVSLTLLIGFYLLVLVVAAVLIAIPILEWTLADRIHLQALIAPVVGLSLLRAVLPRRSTFEAPGPAFDATNQPELTRLVERVAAAVGQPVPAETYLIDEVNAFVTQVGGFLGFGGRRVLAVGVPLMQVMKPEELEAVLAHEFGHFHGGDTRLGPVIYQTRAAMGRTLEATSSSVLRKLFGLYASFYIGVTQAISRAQELGADHLAASTTSAHTAASSLARLPVASTAFLSYRQGDYETVLEAGHRVPYLDGFHSYMAGSLVQTARGDIARESLTETKSSRFDSHPSTGERIRALGFDPERFVDLPPPTHVAASLLHDPAAVEEALVRNQLVVPPESLGTIRWADVGDRVTLPLWRSLVDEVLVGDLPRYSPATLPVDPDGLAALGEQVFAARHRSATRPQREDLALHLGIAVLGVSAAEAGWRVDASPGAIVHIERDGETVELFDRYTEVTQGKLPLAEWRRLLADTGLADIGEAQTATATGTTPASAAKPSPVAPGAFDDEGAEPHPADETMTSYEVELPRTGLGARKVLKLDGATLTYGDVELHAHDITAVSYVLNRSNGNQATFVLHRGDIELKIVIASMKADAFMEPFQALIGWLHRLVSPRIVDRYLEEIRAGRTVRFDDVSFTPDGLTSGRKSVPWSELAGAAFLGQHIQILKVADTLEGVANVVRVKAKVPNAVFIDELVKAAASLRRNA